MVDGRKLTRVLHVVLVLAMLMISAGDVSAKDGGKPEMVTVIVHSCESGNPNRAIRGLGANVEQRLGLIDGISVTVPLHVLEKQIERGNGRLGGCVVSANTEVRLTATANTADSHQIASTTNEDRADYLDMMGVRDLHAAGVTGDGVTVAILDSGYGLFPGLVYQADGSIRHQYAYDAILDIYRSGSDENGHGSHLAGIIFDSQTSESGAYMGVAPDASYISVKAFDWEGKGTYADIINGIDWVVMYKDKLSIDVLNLSFAAPPQSFYWNDPLNQAVMRAWEAGIVVVAAAGNGGPDAMTVGVPGNVPYIITVGAYSDNLTRDPKDDQLAFFSSAGPTVEGFVKPEVLAPGYAVQGLMPHDSTLATSYPDWYTGSGNYYEVSGTSQATAMTSGLVALILEQNPNLTPDQVKCALMSSARPAVQADGTLAYSIFQQGAGLIYGDVDITTSTLSCANVGLDISRDLVGKEHYSGRANIDEDGNYYIMGLEGYAWGEDYAWAEGYAWAENYAWAEDYAWAETYAWAEDYAWGEDYAWAETYAWAEDYAWAETYAWGE